MIPSWIFLIFILLFVGVIIWERWDYRNLFMYTETLEIYLDKYISKYGPSFGITIENTREDIDADIK